MKTKRPTTTKTKRGARAPSFDQAVEIVIYLMSGRYNQHDIAAFFGFNPGRISEVNTGKRHPGAKAEARRRLGMA